MIDRQEATQHFSALLDGLAERPLNYFAELYGLSYGAVLDLVQGRVLPSRAMVVLLHAISLDPMWMRDVAKSAHGDLKILDTLRGKRRTVRNIITRKNEEDVEAPEA